MSNPHLPPEILDYIVDSLHDESETLQNCCLVAKSWVPSARKHLFADVEFSSLKTLESWKMAFPDASNSPAYHTRTLVVKCVRAFVEADAEEGDLIQSFSRIEQLVVKCRVPETSIAPFYKCSSLKSLHVYSFSAPPRHVFHLVHSLPLLEDLALFGGDIMLATDGLSTVVPLTSPPLTGTLKLVLYRQGMSNVTRLLLNLPNGLYFRRLNLSYHDEGDLQWIAKLVDACSSTLECLGIASMLDDGFTPYPIDLSKATKLKDVVFRCASLINVWVTMTLETITSRHRDLQQISIDVTDILRYEMPGHGFTMKMIENASPGVRWSSLDRLLLKLWDSHSIRPKAIDSRKQNEKRETRDWAGFLFPEVTKRGIIDLVEESSGLQ